MVQQRVQKVYQWAASKMTMYVIVLSNWEALKACYVNRGQTDGLLRSLIDVTFSLAGMPWLQTNGYQSLPVVNNEKWIVTQSH